MVGSYKAPAFLTISSHASQLPNELPLFERQTTAFVVCSGQRRDTESDDYSTGAVQAPASPAAFALPGGLPWMLATFPLSPRESPPAPGPLCSTGSLHPLQLTL